MASNRRRRLPLLFIALSVPAFALHSGLLWVADDGGVPFVVPFSIAVRFLWLAVLAWVAWTIHRGAPGAKGLLLFIACLVGVLSVIDLFDEDEPFALFALGAVEAALLYAAYVTTPFVAPPEAEAAKRGVLRNLWRVLKYLLIAWGAICGLLVAFVVALVYWWMSSGVFSTEDFDSQAWLKPAASKDDDSCYRGRMAGDIKKRLLTAGMSRADVERLLGQPDGIVGAGEYRYALGTCSGLQTEDSLHIFFDRQGTFERAAIAGR